jgi:hypothetical protein
VAQEPAPYGLENPTQILNSPTRKFLRVCAITTFPMRRRHHSSCASHAEPPPSSQAATYGLPLLSSQRGRDGPLLEASGSRARLPRNSPRRHRTAGSHGAVQPHCSGILSPSPTRPWWRSLQRRGSLYRAAVCRPKQAAFTARRCFPYAANAAAVGRVPVVAGFWLPGAFKLF